MFKCLFKFTRIVAVKVSQFFYCACHDSIPNDLTSENNYLMEKKILPLNKVMHIYKKVQFPHL